MLFTRNYQNQSMLVETTELAIVASFLRHRVVTGLCVKYEALATCRTNIDCLQTLLDALRATNQRHCVHGTSSLLDNNVQDSIE